MNQGLFRLVFNKRLGLYVPAHEMAYAHGSRGQGRRARRRLLSAIIAAMVVGPAYADVLPLPVSGLVPGGGAWTNAYISAATPAITTIQQSAPQAIANWSQFNLARDHTLNINQQSTWSMLHRIHDQNPSVIAGTINAAGTNYFVNTNGIIFANGAQVNVGSLMALTSADMTDALFTSGLLSSLSNAPVFRNTGGFIKVEQGAALTAASGGRITLLAKDVENSGIIKTPDGQTILAAGEQVYLKSSTDPAGLLVEVNSGGNAVNLGEIVADRGNVTLIGLAVNQQGKISASTSVRANGSIHLLARDTVNATNAGDGSYNYTPQRYGTVTIGEKSVTEVRVETNNTEETLAGQALTPSRINIEGRNIAIDGLVRAKGGEVNISAKAGLESGQGATDPVRVFLGDNAYIDVSGVDARAPMSRNQLQVQLYSDQLKDVPILRGGDLFGGIVYIDARKGTDLIDIEPLLALQTQTIAEKMSAGGTVNITSQGDVVTKAGSVIDVSGGVIDYDAGYIKESILVYQGQVTAISQASKEIPYSGLADVYKYTDPKWGWTQTVYLKGNDKGIWQQAYREGRDAGTVNITSSDNNPLLAGSMLANTRYDLTQRNNLPDGGSFNLTTGNGQVQVAKQQLTIAEGFDRQSDNESVSTVLSTAFLGTGFNHLSIDSLGRIDVNTAVETDPNGSVSLKGGGVNVNASITSAGGDIALQTQLSGQSVTVADNVVLSTAGNWNNDVPVVPGANSIPVALNGGSIQVAATQNIVLGQGSLLDASAGAWIDSQGQLHTGEGGNITLEAANLTLNGKMTAYGFSRGGELGLTTAQNVQIGGEPASGGDFWLQASFFEQGGFSRYAIKTTGTESQFTVGDASGRSTLIHPKMQTLLMSAGYSRAASGASMSQVAAPLLQSEGLRAPVSLDFSAFHNAQTFGSLTVLENTTIRTDAPDVNGNIGAINLEAGRQLTVLGNLISPGGEINLSLSGSLEEISYDNRQSIWIGDKALISAVGHYLIPDVIQENLLNARVFDGGTISLNAEKGFVVTEAGSVLDVSGRSGAVDVEIGGNAERKIIDGAAGEINITAREGMILDGDLLGRANGSGEAGSLNIALKGNIVTTSQGSNPPTVGRVLTVTAEKQVLGNALDPRDSLAAFEGKAQISTAQIDAGQFDHVSLESTTSNREPNASQRDRIVLESGVKLQAPETLALTSSAFEVTGNGVAEVNASHVALAAPQINNTVTAGDATFRVNADWIDLNGSPNIAGVQRTELNSRLDIRMRSLVYDNTGSLRTPGDLLMTARQIYPVSNTSFSVEAIGPDSNITIKSSGEQYKPVYSAGSTLSLKADTIDQQGVLLAPLGQISLDAASRLTLADGSLTSTSAAGLSIPYGTTMQGGTDWNLPNSYGDTPEEKRISYTSKEVNLESGAVIDISGGGDTFAFEWIQGIGGSTDILAQSGIYAIHPAIGSDYAPFDYDYTTGTAPKIGQAVYISGMPGLAAGYYTLLPARYALLEGAYMLQMNPSQQVKQGISTVLLDGSSLTSGFITNVNRSSREGLWQTFRVTDGKVFRPETGAVSRAPSEYMLSYGSEYFSDKALSAGLDVPRLAADAGQLILSATENLKLNATLKTEKGEGGRGAMVDIVSDKISVVSEVGADDGTLQITAGALNEMGADSILLGGIRSQGDEVTQIATYSSEVRFANGEDSGLSLNELIATASGQIKVESGAVISTVQNSGYSTSNLRVNGDGALVAVSGSNDIVFDRTGASNNPVSGILDIQDNSSIQAGRSLVLDATRESRLDGQVTVSDGGSVTLGANSIILGDADSSIEGMRIDDSLVAGLGNLERVTLNSHRNLNIYGAVEFGNSDLDMTINAAGIVGHEGAAGEAARLSAGNLVIKNSSGATYEPGGTGLANQLVIDAGTITVEGVNQAASNTPANAGSFAISGYQALELNSAQDLKFSNSGSIALHADQATISSQRIVTAAGADFTLVADGSLTTQGNGGQAQLGDGGLGGQLHLEAQELQLEGSFVLPSGQFTARATQGDLVLQSDARVDVASRMVEFDRFNAYTPGGVVSLQSDQGDINLASGSEIDVSGSAGGNAGSIRMSAVHGNVSVAQGSLKGEAGDGKTAGSFSLDSGRLSDLSALNAVLNAGGFNAGRELRVRTGDVNIAAADVVNAESFVLSADTGAITVAGTIDASGQDGGSIRLYSKNDLTIVAGGSLQARAAASDGKGGDVLLSSENGTIRAEVFEADGSTHLANAALIDVSGSERGQVNMRAAREGVAGLKVDTDATAAVAGADKILLESVKVTDVATTLNATTLNNIAADTTAFYADAGNAAAAYKASSDGVSAIVAPHTELRIDGDATLASDWNLSTLSQGRDGVLTIRSSGNMQLNGSISDGFATALAAGVLAAGDSWSLNLVSGADFSAANTLSTIRSESSGNMVLANSKLVRTGTGDINIATGGNLTLSNTASVIYTAGNAAASLDGFVAPISTDGFGTNGAQYLTNGGDLYIESQGNITGALVNASGTQQSVNNWLFRQAGGTANKHPTWWLRTDLFQQGVAAFGGGDVKISSGGNITNFSASVPTTARYAPDGSVAVDGGGNLSVVADGDILNGMYFVAKGELDLQAGGEIGRTFNAQGNAITLGTTLALQDATANVAALGNVYIESVFNPTLFAQSTTNAQSVLNQTGRSAFFNTYSDSAAVDVASLGGSVTFGLTGASISTITNKFTGMASTTNSIASLAYYPGTVNATAFGGDINVGIMKLMPNSEGNLSLLAAGNIRADQIVVSDAEPSLVPGARSPIINPTGGGSNLDSIIVNNHAAVPLHRNSTTPIAIVAQDGSLTSWTTSAQVVTLTLPKASVVVAGQDIRNLNASLQNLNDGDLSVVRAGRDLYYDSQSGGINISGPGNLLVEAGRNLDLGLSNGINSLANTVNAALPAQGASLTVLAGVGEGARLADYIDLYIKPDGSGPSVLQANENGMAEYRAATAEALAKYMRELTGNLELSGADALTAYLALETDQQAVFAYRHFSSELLASGRAYASTQSHERGDAAIATLFPGDYQGDMSLFQSRIRTVRDGSIDLLAPGGLINVGVPGGTASGNIGVVTEGGGDIRAFAETGFQVNQSRVITQYGSDITVWVNHGDIDAGRGSKTALSIPDVEISTDVYGNTTRTVKGAAAGSGIQAQTYDPDGPDGPAQAPRLGTVSLMAPRGVLNASEAGIVAGDFLAVAPQIIGANNISVSGQSVGMSMASTVSLATSVVGASTAASSATSTATDFARMPVNQDFNPRSMLPSFVSVEVLGLGDIVR
ncbi:filamentous hemagglutinin family protein [Methylobacillus arboreus]|uniref:filamentous haemagglutinin family protein n=1 Tax=Methylobacillus arboreus TaxID=755170 RepID=UPI001E505A6A|nr:filamentous haemagglutinin family protein [Methylobacillus arboreus]MCB5190616.1 filamentous hemagglutinin family protein [Methylobacillus arboreus]